MAIHENFKKELTHYLPEDQVEQFLETCRKPLKKSVTINRSKIDDQELIEMTKNRGWHFTDNMFEIPGSARYIDRDDTTIALGNSFLHQAGFLYIQEVAASLPAPTVDVKDGDIVLDMAAAPGGKASQLSVKLLGKDHPGMVITNDVNGKRIPQLAHNLNRGGCWNTAITKFNGSMFGKHLPNFFDHVILDAPCSGEGTAFKSDYALKFRKREEINKIAGTQFQLLISAIKTTKPGGTITYSTCTINPYENEHILEKACEFFGDSIEIEAVHVTNTNDGILSPEGEYKVVKTTDVARCRSHIQKTGGFFISRIRKLKATELKPGHDYHTHKLLPRNQFSLEKSKKLFNEVTEYLSSKFGITLNPKRHRIVASKEKVYLCSPTFDDMYPHLHCEKIGVPILKKDRLLGFRPTHYLGNIFGHLATKLVIDISDEQAQLYSQGKYIPLDQFEESVLELHQRETYRILTRRGKGFSTTKIVKGELKNKFGK